jgi:hypothetical protein
MDLFAVVEPLGDAAPAAALRLLPDSAARDFEDGGAAALPQAAFGSTLHLPVLEDAAGSSDDEFGGFSEADASSQEQVERFMGGRFSSPRAQPPQPSMQELAASFFAMEATMEAAAAAPDGLRLELEPPPPLLPEAAEPTTSAPNSPPSSAPGSSGCSSPSNDGSTHSSDGRSSPATEAASPREAAAQRHGAAKGEGRGWAGDGWPPPKPPHGAAWAAALAAAAAALGGGRAVWADAHAAGLAGALLADPRAQRKLAGLGRVWWCARAVRLAAERGGLLGGDGDGAPLSAAWEECAAAWAAEPTAAAAVSPGRRDSAPTFGDAVLRACAAAGPALGFPPAELGAAAEALAATPLGELAATAMGAGRPHLGWLDRLWRHAAASEV